MIRLPDEGMRRSINAHNVNEEALCDWIEGNILFAGEELSITDVSDILIENQIYDSQDFASEMIGNVWTELHRRIDLIDADDLPVELAGKRGYSTGDWRDSPAYSFCLMLSFAAWYPEWARGFGDDYTDQGSIFEELTKECLLRFFPGWEVHLTGWAKNNIVTIDTVVRDVADLLHEAQGDVGRWVDDTANEIGLDLICYRPFDDNRVGKPVFLVQCASGKKWYTKLKTPDPQIWNKIISWASYPKKGFSMPFSLQEKDFIKKCGVVDGLFLDRYRLLSVGRNTPGWVSEPLRNRIIEWMEPRVDALPAMV